MIVRLPFFVSTKPPLPARNETPAGREIVRLAGSFWYWPTETLPKEMSDEAVMPCVPWRNVTVSVPATGTASETGSYSESPPTRQLPGVNQLPGLGAVELQ